MFRKVLIAEDHEIANISVQKTLHELGIVDAKYVYYCDHALSWVRSALDEGQPYDLLITDLEFEDDHTPQQIKGGIELIWEVKALQPDIKVIVLTATGLSPILQEMFRCKKIDAYVRKARNDRQHLHEALEAIAKHKTYQSPDYRRTIQERNTHEFTALDIHIIKLLYEGVPQKEMPLYLGQRNVKPNSLSSIEKRLNLMKDVLGFSKNEQLVAHCKEIHII